MITLTAPTARASLGLDAVELEAVLTAIADRHDASTIDTRRVLDRARRAVERELHDILTAA